MCDCQGTFHQGQRCQTGYLPTVSIPILRANSVFPISISYKPVIQREVTVLPNNSTALTISGPTLFTLTPPDSSFSYTILPRYIGLYKVSYSVRPPTHFITPEDTIVLVRPQDVSSSSRSDDIALDVGCCNQQLGLTPTQCFNNLTFKSSCQWSYDGGSNDATTGGIVFVSGQNGIELPVSIAGVRVSTDSSLSLPIRADGELEQCGVCPADVTSTCTPTTSTDTFNITDLYFLVTQHSLPNTFFSRIASVLPSWLRIHIHSDSSQSTYSLYDYSSFIGSISTLQQYEGCNKVSVEDNGQMVYALRTHSAIQFTVDSASVVYIPTSSEPFCVVVSICDNNRILASVPQILQPSSLTSLSYINKIISNDGSLTFHSIKIETVATSVAIDSNRFWNGSGYFDAEIASSKFSLDISLSKSFKGSSLNVDMTFEGSVQHQSKSNESQVQMSFLYIHVFHYKVIPVGSRIVNWSN